MTRALAVLAFVFGSLIGIFALFLLAAVVSVAVQGKPPDLLSTFIGLALLALAAFALRWAWLRWRAGDAAVGLP